MKTLATTAILVILLASGCTMPGSGENGTPSPTSSTTYSTRPACQYSLCLAQPTSNNYATPMERYGLRQINDDEPEEFAIGVEGELVAWAWSDYEHATGPGTGVGHIAAYNISTGKLVTIEDEPYFHDTRAYLDGGRVVFTRLPEEGAPEGPGASYMVLWDSKTEQKRKLETGLDGTAQSFGFDGHWASFWTTHNTDSTKDGVWLLNVDDGRTIHLFHRPTQEQFLSGQEWAPDANSIVHGRYAYYSIAKMRQDGSRLADERFVQYDIETGATRILFESTEGSARTTASDRYVAWEVPSPGPSDGHRIRVYDLATNETWIPTTAEEGGSGFPHLGGEWLTYSRALGQVPRGLVALHLPTGEKHLLFDFNNGFSANEAATDGIRFVVDGHRHNKEAFDSLGTDLYWGNLPTGV